MALRYCIRCGKEFDPVEELNEDSYVCSECLDEETDDYDEAELNWNLQYTP